MSLKFDCWVISYLSYIFYMLTKNVVVIMDLIVVVTSYCNKSILYVKLKIDYWNSTGLEWVII